jgi:hypothetical protein
MKVIELFAGSRSIGKAAEQLGLDVWSTDLHPFDGVDLAEDILKLSADDIPHAGEDTILWASPPCTGFSVASIGRHWGGGFRAYEPKTDTARLGMELVQHTLKLIEDISPRYWFIENPRGMLRKLPIMEGLTRHTVTYCQYGDERMKPTDIWTNCEGWTPRPACKNGMSCHVAAPRGSSTGTQGRKGNYERSKIPHDLCKEVLISAMLTSVGWHR